MNKGNNKESSLVKRKSERQAIFKFKLPLASKGIRWDRMYPNRISRFKAQNKLIRRSLEFFRISRKNIDNLSFLTPAALMPILILATILSTACVNESQAGDSAPTSGTCNETGTCLWSFADGKLSITAKGNATNVMMDNYADWDNSDYDEDWDYFLNVPWIEHRKNITSVEIGDGIKNIGGGSFMGLTNLKTVTGMKDVATIEEEAFNGAKSLENIDLSAITSIGNSAFMSATSLTNVEMPNVEFLGTLAFNGTGLTSVDLPNLKKSGDIPFDHTGITYANIPSNIEYCLLEDGIEKCETWNGSCSALLWDSPICNSQSYNKCSSHIVDEGTENAKEYVICGSCDGYTKSGTGCVTECGVGYLGKNGRCIPASQGCGENFKLNDGECDRIRYTPAEAAEILKDNGNIVTITFKM